MTAPLRDVMPPRICVGFERICTTPLSKYNPDSVCGVCSAKRAEAIAARGISVPAGLPTHCCHDHEYTVANTYYTKRGYRKCRECARVREFDRRPERTW